MYGYISTCIFSLFFFFYFLFEEVLKYLIPKLLSSKNDDISCSNSPEAKGLRKSS